MANKRKNLCIPDIHRWYLVGLIASDGCLSSDGRHVDITSKDYEFIYTVRTILNLPNKIGIKNKNKINQAFHIQISNKNFYEFLLRCGLTPNKSLSLSALDIPEEFFSDFLRGFIDGDGSIRRWLHSSNNVEQWSLRIYSASRIFIQWLCAEIAKNFGSEGKIHSALRPNRKNLIYTLKYGKIAAKKILKSCYYPRALSMHRKMMLAEFLCRDGGTGIRTGLKILRP